MASGGPISVTCHLCGRGFGTTSIAIHAKQCVKKRAAQQAKVRWPRCCRRRLTPSHAPLAVAAPVERADGVYFMCLAGSWTARVPQHVCILAVPCLRVSLTLRASPQLDAAVRTSHAAAPDVPVPDRASFPSKEEFLVAVEAYNEAAQAAYNSSMPQCQCGRCVAARCESRTANASHVTRVAQDIRPGEPATAPKGL